MRAALDPNGADAYWAGRFGLIPLLSQSNYLGITTQSKLAQKSIFYFRNRQLKSFFKRFYLCIG